MIVVVKKYKSEKIDYVAENNNNIVKKQEAQIIPFKSPGDDLHETLEMRYGPGFAQWVMDGLVQV